MLVNRKCLVAEWWTTKLRYSGLRNFRNSMCISSLIWKVCYFLAYLVWFWLRSTSLKNSQLVPKIVTRKRELQEISVALFWESCIWILQLSKTRSDFLSSPTRLGDVLCCCRSSLHLGSCKLSRFFLCRILMHYTRGWFESILFMVLFILDSVTK